MKKKKVEDVSFEGEGCAISLASASILTETIKGKEYNNANLIIKDFSETTSASPKVRKFARELGVDISKVLGSERKGRVTEVDIKSFVSTKSNAPLVRSVKSP